MTPLPSGEQIELQHGAQRLVVTQVGAAIREYAIGERQVVDGFAADEMCPGAAGQFLAPWPNRIDGGRYAFGGSEHQLALTEPALGHAIHGLVRWSAWEVAEAAPAHAVLRHRLHPQPGYPFLIDFDVRFGLDDDGARITTTVTNRSDDIAPIGVGWHPYFTTGTESVDDIVLHVRADRVLERDDRFIPTGDELRVAGTPLDFSTPRRIGSTVLDRCYAGVARGSDGLGRVSLDGPEGAVEIWMDGSYDHLMLFTADTLPAPRRRRSLAVEPMTCPPNAFRTGVGLKTLRPEEVWTTTWGVRGA